MSDLDELIRESLRTAARDVHAPADGLERLRLDAGVSNRRRWWARAGVAAALVGVVVAGWVLLAGDERSPEVVDVPVPTTQLETTTSTTAVPANPAAVDPRTVSIPMPGRIVAAIADGRLVVLDVSSGEVVRELARRDPLGLTEVEGDGNAIDGVAVGPDGGTVYFSTCCSPIVGTTEAVSIEPVEPDPASGPVRYGAWPSISPDGSRLALVTDELSIIDLPTDEASRIDVGLGGDGRPARWLGDRTIAAERLGTGASASSVLVVRAVDTAEPTIREITSPAGDGDWVRPVGTEELLVVVEQCCEFEPAHDGAAVGRFVDVDSGKVVGSFDVPGPVTDTNLVGNWFLGVTVDGRPFAVDLRDSSMHPVALGDTQILAAAWVPGS